MAETLGSFVIWATEQVKNKIQFDDTILNWYRTILT